MEKLLGPMWDFVKDRLSVQEVLLLMVLMLLVYAWHQFHRARNLTEFNEQERRRAQLAVEDLERLKADTKTLAGSTDRRQGDDSAERRQRCTSRVLVVEDNEVMQTIIPAMLARCLSSVEVKVRESAQGALEELEAFNPELLVLDLRLKKESGLALISHLREVNSNIPVLVYSGYDHDIEQLRSDRGGAGLDNVTILQKGSDLDAFMRIVPTLFRRRAVDRASGQRDQGNPSKQPSGAVNRERRRMADRRALRGLGCASVCALHERRNHGRRKAA